MIGFILMDNPQQLTSMWAFNMNPDKRRIEIAKLRRLYDEIPVVRSVDHINKTNTLDDHMKLIDELEKELELKNRYRLPRKER